MKRCFFIGHADISDELFPPLCHAIHQHITEYGVLEFYAGNHGRFDAMVRRALREAKQIHPQIRNFLITAYHPGLRTIELPDGMDEVFYPLEKSVPPRFALPAANRAMVDQCSYLITAVNRPGRSREILDYAQRKAKKTDMHITNLLNT